MKKYNIINLVILFLSFLICGCSASQFAWENANKSNTVNAYRTFLKNYSKTTEADFAKDSIDSKELKIVSQSEDLNGYINYVSNYRHSPYLDIANKKLRDLLKSYHPLSDNEFNNIKNNFIKLAEPFSLIDLQWCAVDNGDNTNDHIYSPGRTSGNQRVGGYSTEMNGVTKIYKTIGLQRTCSTIEGDSIVLEITFLNSDSSGMHTLLKSKNLERVEVYSVDEKTNSSVILLSLKSVKVADLLTILVNDQRKVSAEGSSTNRIGFNEINIFRNGKSIIDHLVCFEDKWYKIN